MRKLVTLKRGKNAGVDGVIKNAFCQIIVRDDRAMKGCIKKILKVEKTEEKVEV